jgi:hypothetical protein
MTGMFSDVNSLCSIKLSTIFVCLSMSYAGKMKEVSPRLCEIMPIFTIGVGSQMANIAITAWRAGKYALKVNSKPYMGASL